MNLMDLLLGVWRPPLPTRSRVYRMLGANKSKAVPIFAKAKILTALNAEWKNNKQIAEETGLQVNTVQQKTARLYNAGKIDRIMKKCNSDTKPVCMYRKKDVAT